MLVDICTLGTILDDPVKIEKRHHWRVLANILTRSEPGKVAGGAGDEEARTYLTIDACGP